MRNVCYASRSAASRCTRRQHGTDGHGALRHGASPRHCGRSAGYLHSRYDPNGSATSDCPHVTVGIRHVRMERFILSGRIRMDLNHTVFVPRLVRQNGEVVYVPVKVHAVLVRNVFRNHCGPNG